MNVIAISTLLMYSHYHNVYCVHMVFDKIVGIINIIYVMLNSKVYY